MWVHTTYDELSKLGLREVTEQRMRAHPDKQHPQRSGLLIVDQLIQSSHASETRGGGGQASDTSDSSGGGLDVGDVLLAIDGVSVTCFLALADCLDNAVGKCVAATVERGGFEITVTGLSVEDLHSFTPNEFLECSGAVLHSISFMQVSIVARDVRLKQT